MNEDPAAMPVGASNTVAPALGLPAVPARHPLLERLVAQFGYPDVSAECFAVFAAQAGHTLLFLAEDPARIKETLDLAVIVPELAAAFPHRFRVGVLLPPNAATIAPKYGIRRWPALLMLRDGRYVGAIEGIRNWDDYVGEVTRLLQLEPSDPPVIVVALTPMRRDGGHGHDH